MVMIWTNRRAFHRGRIIFPPAPFLSFLPLSLNNISVLFPSRCRAMGGEEGTRFCCPCLTGVCSVCGNLYRRSETWGWLPWGDHGGMLGTTATAPWCGREQGRARRGGRALGRGWCPGAASLLSSGGDDPLSSQVGGGWLFLLESAQWTMDLGRLLQKCIFMKFQMKVLPSEGSIFENLSYLSGRAWLRTF